MTTDFLAAASETVLQISTTEEVTFWVLATLAVLGAVAVVAAALVLGPAAAVAHSYGLTGVSMLWSLAQCAVALIASWRLIALTHTKASSPAVQIPSSAGQEPTGMETP